MTGPLKIQAKICGINHPDALRAALDGGARYIGLVFFPRSPRHVELAIAADLARMVGTGTRTVGLFVDPADALLDETIARVPLDMIQLHGEENPARVADIRARYGLPVMKALKVADEADLEAASAYLPVVDRLLFDAKPPKNVANMLPGGNGLSFDWRLLAGRRWDKPWMLSGGLDPANVAEAIAITGADAVDVSSGVEERPGVKSVARIRDFLAAVAAAGQGA